MPIEPISAQSMYIKQMEKISDPVEEAIIDTFNEFIRNNWNENTDTSTFSGFDVAEQIAIKLGISYDEVLKNEYLEHFKIYEEDYWSVTLLETYPPIFTFHNTYLISNDDICLWD